MELETRQAALRLIRHGKTLLVAEIQDPQTGAFPHRPPGGGIEECESAEQAVRRELHEELGIRLAVFTGRRLSADAATGSVLGPMGLSEIQEAAWPSAQSDALDRVG